MSEREERALFLQVLSAYGVLGAGLLMITFFLLTSQCETWRSWELLTDFVFVCDNVILALQKPLIFGAFCLTLSLRGPQ